MEERDIIDDEDETIINDKNSENNNINYNNKIIINTDSNNNKKNNINNIKESNISLDISSNNNNNIEEEYLDNEDDINLEELKFDSKILCPNDNCYLNSIIYIDYNFFEVSYNCGNHSDKINIIDFIKKINKKKENNSCSICKKEYSELEENNKKLYYCSCKKNICEECKENHLINQNKNQKHIMVNFKEKEYTCCCSKNLKKYSGFCINCKKNFCAHCKKEHDDDDHNIKNYFEIFKLGKKQKEEIKLKLKKQKELIEKFEKIIDKWLKKTKNFIYKYKKSLELYWEINNKIYNQSDINNVYYQQIMNIKNIQFDFEENFNDLIKSENDYIRQNEIIFKMLKENIRRNTDNKKKNNNIFNNKNLEEKDIKNVNKIVNNICELKKEGLLILNISENDIENLYVYKILKENKNEVFEDYSIHTIEDGKILDLLELKNGNLLLTQKKYFKIIELTKDKNEINIIQNEKFINENINQIIELINGNLISIGYIPNMNNTINFWKKNLITEQYNEDVGKQIKIDNYTPISIMEINKNIFLVLFIEENHEDKKNQLNIIKTYDTITNKELEWKLRIKVSSNFKKMIKVNEKNIICLYSTGIILINLYHKQSSKFYGINENIIFDNICSAPNSNRFFLVSFYEKKKKKNLYGIKKISCNLFFHELYFNEEYEIIYENKITSLIKLSNENIITASEDKNIKIWELK